MNDEADER